MDDTKTQILLKLVPWLQTSRVGVTYEEIAERFGGSDRSARRWVAELQGAFPCELKSSEPDGDGRKRWRLDSPMTGSPFTSLTPEDVTALDTAAALFKKDRRKDLLQGLENVRNLTNAYVQRSTNPGAFQGNVNDLVEAEGFIMRPGPKFEVESGIMRDLRDAILKYERIRIRYGKGDRIIEPYGFLYGKKHYLVAFLARKQESSPRLLILTKIRAVKFLKETFTHRKGFDLRSYANQSFGVFQGDTVNVLWRFSPHVAEEARRFVFHPTQKTKIEPDGSLLVSFRASGQVEMACHLMSWEGEVEVLKPASLRELVVELGEKAVEANSRP